MTEIAYLALGTNLGNKKKNLEQAISILNDEAGNVLHISRTYTSESKGFEGLDFFYCCVELHTELSPIELLHKCQDIEKRMGRVKNISIGYENRIIDIDIVYYGNKVLNSRELNIPHKEALNRSFVILPLSDIAHDFKDPLTKVTIKKAATKFLTYKDTEVSDLLLFDERR